MQQQVVFGWPNKEILTAFGKWLSIVLSCFLVTYLTANELASQNSNRYEMYTQWELGIPLVPWMILVYLSYVGVFLLLPFIMKSGDSIANLAYGFLTSILISTMVFVVFPGELGYARPEFIAGFDFLYQSLYTIDQPHNLYPSLHVTFSSLTAMAMAHQAQAKWFHVAIALWAVLIAASVILVHQHHLFDVATGLLLGSFCFRYVYMRNFEKPNSD
jgi:membrane-associated phospholipid phosphatase